MNVAEQEDFVQMNAEENGGGIILRNETKKKLLSTNLFAHNVDKNLFPMGTRGENTAVIIAILNLDFGVMKIMETRNLKKTAIIDADLIARKKHSFRIWLA